MKIIAIGVEVSGEVIATFVYPLDAWRFVGEVLDLDAEEAMSVVFRRGLLGERRLRVDFTGKPNALRRSTGNRYWSSGRMIEAKRRYLKWAD
jgi:hypothetical protein